MWIGRGTRYIVIDFTIYNANVNLFCVIKSAIFLFFVLKVLLMIYHLLINVLG